MAVGARGTQNCDHENTFWVNPVTCGTCIDGCQQQVTCMLLYGISVSTSQLCIKERLWELKQDSSSFLSRNIVLMILALLLFLCLAYLHYRSRRRSTPRSEEPVHEGLEMETIGEDLLSVVLGAWKIAMNSWEKLKAEAAAARVDAYKARMDEDQSELYNLRFLNLDLASRIAAQGQIIWMCYAAKQLIHQPNPAYVVEILCISCFYMITIYVTWGVEKRKRSAVRPAAISAYLVLLFKIWTCPNLEHYAVSQMHNMALAFTMATVFVDTWLTIPLGVCVFGLDAWTFSSMGGEMSLGPMSRYLYALLLYVIVACCAEHTGRRFIQKLLDANSMVEGFRRMLTAISDGDVLIDSHFHIHGEPQSFLNIPKSMSILLQEFVKFVEKSSQADSCQSAPPCVRIHLRSKYGASRGLDVCHVLVQDLFGSVEPYHLIVFKEDPEQREDPSASADSIPEELLKPRVVPRSITEASDARREGVGGEGAGIQFGRTFQELAEMSFVLDGSTEQFDILQAKLNFERRTRKPDAWRARAPGSCGEGALLWGSGDVHSRMPHLQKFARPVDA
eukprot:g29926.t1